MPDWEKTLRQRVGDLGLDSADESEVFEELAQHLEDRCQELRASGLDGRQARRRTLAEMGDCRELAAALRQSRARQSRVNRANSARPELPGPAAGLPGAGLLRDLRLSFRNLLRNRGFSAAALLTLALGIGISVSVFSIVYGVLFRPLPYSEPDRLALLRVDTEGYEFIAALSAPELLDLREQSSQFEELAGIWASSVALTDGEQPDQIRYSWVTANFFPMLGIDPLLGRRFRPDEDKTGSDPVVILSEGLWRRRYDADPEIVGRSVELDDNPRTVVGVMPAGFRMPNGAVALELEEFDAWIPQTYWINRGQRWLRIFGRLRPGASFEQAQTEVDGIAERLRKAHPEYANTEFRLHVVPLHGDVVRNARPAMLALLAAVAFVLLTSVANVAGLLLVRFAARRRETAICRALGASRWSIIRKFLVENALLVGLGGTMGIALAYWLTELLVYLGGANLPRLQDIRLDGPVLLASAAAAAATAVLLGLPAAWRASRSPALSALRSGPAAGGAALRGRNFLTVAQVAISLMLLIGAGLMVRTFTALKRVNPGFRAEHVLTFRTPIAFANFKDGESRWRFYQNFKEGIEQLPQVEAAGGVSLLPLGGGLLTGPYAYDAASDARWGQLGADYRTVTPGYFETLGIPLVEGRLFTEADGLEKRRVAIVDERLALSAWPGQSAVGRKLKLMINPSGNQLEEDWVDVIGVVRHVRVNGLREDGPPQAYRPFWLDNPIQMYFAVRSRGDHEALSASIRDLAAALNSGRAVYRFRRLDEYLEDAVSETRFTLSLMSGFAGVAILLAAVGLFGLISYSVQQRRREVGVRMALGADPWAILRMVLAGGLWLACAGAAVGIGGALLLTGYLENLLFGVSPSDPLTYAALAAALILVAVAASAAPAWRAARVDPASALRTE